MNEENKYLFLDKKDTADARAQGLIIFIALIFIFYINYATGSITKFSLFGSLGIIVAVIGIIYYNYQKRGLEILIDSEKISFVEAKEKKLEVLKSELVTITSEYVDWVRKEPNRDQIRVIFIKKDGEQVVFESRVAKTVIELSERLKRFGYVFDEIYEKNLAKKIKTDKEYVFYYKVLIIAISILFCLAIIIITALTCNI